MKNIWVVALLLFFSRIDAQNPARQFISYKTDANLVHIETNDGNYQILFINPHIVETAFVPKGQTYNPQSHAVILNTSIKPQVADNEGDIDIHSSGICVSITKNPFKITYHYKDKTLLSERLGYTERDTLKVLNFNIGNDDVLYGGGARVLGMNRRGNKLTLYNKAHYGYETRSELMNYTMPLVFSSKIFAVHFDNTPIGFLDLDSQKNNTLNYETIGGRLVYQVIADDSWRGLIENFTALTGRQPLPPIWAFGNFASRFGYHTQAQVEKTVDLFRQYQIPLDAVVVDIYWFSKGIFNEMGDLEFERDSFPNPEKMFSDLKSKKIKSVFVTEPFILKTSKKWDEAVGQGILVKDKSGNPKTWNFYFGNTSLIDIYKPEAAKWFWNIYKNLANMGVDGVWGDLGEPEVHPFDAIHAIGTANEVHNIYGSDWAKLVYEGYKKDFPQTRPFILMRAGAVGSQRYGMIPWSGDVNRSWGGFQAQPEVALQMGMQGLGYMHSDIGGFGATNDPDNELYYRWMQYGVFQPLFRPHAQEEVPSEPVYRDAWVRNLVKKSIELRYRMLPYNYSAGFENNQTGMPFMRPFFYEEPDNQTLLTYDKAFLWGNDILVAPIMQKGQTETEVYFPKNNTWFDFYSDQTYEGGKTYTVTNVQDHIPTFVRGGAFIPLVSVFQNTEDYNLKNLEVHYYFDKKTKQSSFELYNDDGKTPEAYEKTLFETIDFKSQFVKNVLTLNIEPDFGVKYQPYSKNIQLTLHQLNQKPKKIKINGKKVKFNWDVNAAKTFVLPLLINENDVKIKIIF